MNLLVPNPTRNISNSEVTCFLSCKRQYEYAYMQELAPKETAEPLARGTLGHYAFEKYWEARLNNSPHEKAMDYGMEAFANPPEPVGVDVIMKTQFLFHRYMIAHQGFPEWTPLGTEQRHDIKLTESINFSMRYDLFVQNRNNGKTYILDYKFTYDFWSPDDHDLNGQMPKYIAAMQTEGIKVDGGILEEIRTRELGAEKQKDPKNLWRRTEYFPSMAKRRAVLQQQVSTSVEIEKFRSLPVEERKNLSVPVLNKHGACKFCNFKDLCVAELEGKTDLSVDIRVGYTQNTYGYNEKAIDFL